MNPLLLKLSRRASTISGAARQAVSRASGLSSQVIGEARHAAEFAPQPEDEFVAAVYFASDMDSVYQLEQWLWVFEQTAERLSADGAGTDPIGIVVRDISVARHLPTITDLPVRFARRTSDLDRFMTAPPLRIVFYVNQAIANFQGLRYPRPAHVHLSHGESEKSSMISNQLKAYDYVFTAGKAARARIGAQLIGMGEERMIDVGRPQLDRPRSAPGSWTAFSQKGGGPVVFYAPTWEGDSPAMSYGTMATNGTIIVRALLDDGFRVLFRPHPRTGVINPDFRKALESVSALVAGHEHGYLDTTLELGWQFDVADAAVTEMSAVAFDWLTVGKPLVVVRPHNPGAEVLVGGLLDRCPTLSAGEEQAVAEVVRAAVGTGDDEGASAFSDLGRYYLGATAAGDQLERFQAATRSVIDGRSASLDHHPSM